MSFIANTYNLKAKKTRPGTSWGLWKESYCGVINCSSCTRTCPNLWFFKLPYRNNCSNKESLRRQEWLKIIGRREVSHRNILVCEKHFDPRDIITKIHYSKTRKMLKRGAIPKLVCKEESATKTNPTPIKTYQRTNTSEIKVYQNVSKIKKKTMESGQNNTNNSNEDDSELPCLPSLNNTNETLNSLNKLYLLFKDRAETCEKKYSDQYKLKLLQLYTDNSQLYEALQSTLRLPPPSILRDFIPSTQATINSFLLNSLKEKTGLMSLKQKCAALCVSIINIHPHINYDYDLDMLSGFCGSTGVPFQYAVVAMVRGIADNWHHIASVFFIGSLLGEGTTKNNIFHEYNYWLTNLLENLMEIGFYVKIVVSSTDDFFVNAIALRNPSKICFIFDPLHLVLLLYNELKYNDICALESLRKSSTKRSPIPLVAKWEHIHKFYELDSKRKFRLTNTSSFINPNELLQNKLKAAAQIFSPSTATGMSTFIELGILDQKAMDTVHFIFNINKILPTLHHDTLQIHLIDKHTHSFSVWVNNCSMVSLGNANRIEVEKQLFLKYLETNLKSLSRLKKLTTLKEEVPALTQYLNLDPLVDFIHMINLKSFKHKNPTLDEFFEVIKDCCMQNKYHNIKKEVEDDALEDFIENANQLIKQECYNKKKSLKRSWSSNFIDDYAQMEPEDASSIFYVATYLLDKMYKQFKTAVSSRMKFISSSVYYVNRKDGISGSILVPDNEFMLFVYNMDLVFVNYCQKAMSNERVFDELMKKINEIFLTGPVDGAPFEYIKKLFVELRLYHTIKYNNGVYEGDDNGCHIFLVGRLDKHKIG